MSLPNNRPSGNWFAALRSYTRRVYRAVILVQCVFCQLSLQRNMTIMHSRNLHYGHQIQYTFRGRSRVVGLKMRRVLRVDKNATTISFLLLTTLCYNCGVIEGTHEPRGNITWTIAALIVRQLTAPSPRAPSIRSSA